MSDPIRSFYDPLAEHYHLLFDDWDQAIDRQSRVLGWLLADRAFTKSLKILDCACGIGTQALALAKLGHQVSGSDLSAEAVTRARKEALKRSLDIDFRVAGMTSLGSDTDRKFDSVIAFDNALPHLSPDQLERAAPAIRSVLKSGGLLMASIRDYDQIVLDKPTISSPFSSQVTAGAELCIRSGIGLTTSHTWSISMSLGN